MAGTPDISQIRTGTLRRDIEIIPPGRHGAYPMIFDPAAENYFKLSIPAWQMLSRYDRDMPVKEFGERLRRAGIPAEPVEILTLKQFLVQNNLLTPDADTFAALAAQKREAKNKHLWLKIASAYLYFKLPPLHPQPFIDRIKPYIGFIGSKYVFRCLAVVALLGYLLAFRNLPGIKAMLEDSFSWAGLVKYFFAVILLKIIHEAGHLAANMHFNCRVRAIGISVIFLYPRFFSDTTDSWRLPRKQRLLVDAGGLLSEVLCGGIAALAWCYLPPGNLQSTMFFIFAVSTAGTILVNGNPLIRFDGYYILCDILNVENLMQRSGEYLKQFNRHWLFRVGPAPQEERPLLMFSFGIAAFIYRFLLYTSIILVIYNSMIKAVAVILLVLEVLTIFILPFYNEVRIVKALSKRAGTRANLFFVFVLLAAAGLVLFLPLSWRTRLPGEVTCPEAAPVTVLESGYLAADAPDKPVRVRAGQTVLKLVSPKLDMELDRRKALLKENEVLLQQQLNTEATVGDSMLTRQKILSEKARIADLEKRKRLLTVSAGSDGVFVPRYSELSSGAALFTGMTVGVINPSEMRVTAYASDAQLARLESGMKVVFRFRDSDKDCEGVISRINPVPAVFALSPLLSVAGGDIPVQSVPGKPGEFTPVHTMFKVEITPDKPVIQQQGRTLRVLVSNREILFDKFVSSVIYFFRREF
ncbi:MAG: HlyD family efflux transporter periplasmic adaptor subunit [Lentisphaeria bacterium]|nr:HlyD family efflux transporter periplasmic adaptor subunit [Lentisphaeria bacterium]